MSLKGNSTIIDVAKLSGVSKTTVSRYINQSGYVEENNGNRIKNAIEELHFKLSKIARSLKTKRTHQIMLFVPDICNPFYSSPYKSVQHTAQEMNYSVILYNTNEDKREEIEAVKMFEESKADGLIFCSIEENIDII